MNAEANYELLKNKTIELGGRLFGAARIPWVELKLSAELADCQDRYPYAICIGINLLPEVLKTIVDRPTVVYSWHYRQINSLLDQMTLRVAQFITTAGYQALPIAASQIVDWENQRAHISHKHIAYLAGLGWWGKNNLIVNSDFGPAIRFASILTNIPLILDRPQTADCGECKLCIQACPCGAIADKRENFNHRRCFEQLTQFSRLSGIKYHICGICIKACLANSYGRSKPRTKA